MLNKHLMAITNYISKNDIVLDVGTDHAYLPIFLKKNNLCKNVYASDISINALNSAKENILKYHLKIKTILSDGLKDINEKFDTLVISGMGTSTMISILSSPKIPNKIILSSNNELNRLRVYMQNIGYYLKDETAVYDHNKYYSVMYYEKSNKKINKNQLLFGKSNNKEYFKYLLKKEKKIFKSSKKFSSLKRVILLKLKTI